MTVYDNPPRDAVDMLQELLKDCDEFDVLREADVKVELSFAYGKPKKDGTVPDALKYRGQKALGLASLFDLQDRVHGKPDVRITIDGDWWRTPEATDNKKKALLFHELYHFEPVLDEAMAYETDDAGRPKVAIRKHDVEFGWFWATARRYGADSQESMQFKRIVDEGGQLLLPGLGKTINEEEKGAVDFAKAARKMGQAAAKEPAMAH